MVLDWSYQYLLNEADLSRPNAAALFLALCAPCRGSRDQVKNEFAQHICRTVIYLFYKQQQLGNFDATV
jgi:hypothetical protein